MELSERDREKVIRFGRYDCIIYGDWWLLRLIMLNPLRWKNESITNDLYYLTESSVFKFHHSGSNAERIIDTELVATEEESNYDDSNFSVSQTPEFSVWSSTKASEKKSELYRQTSNEKLDNHECESDSQVNNF